MRMMDSKPEIDCPKLITDCSRSGKSEGFYCERPSVR